MTQYENRNLVNYHNCPVHGKERCQNPENEVLHHCQAVISYKVRKEIPSWTEELTHAQDMERELAYDTWKETRKEIQVK